MTGDEFEAEVLRIAAALWPRATKSGPTIIAGRERDGVFVTEDQVALIEATIERTKSKAEKDGKKLDHLAREYGRDYPMHAVKAWFVTLNEPTAEQKDAIQRLKNPAVAAVSFSQFKSRLVDARGYLDARDDHPFGSARALDEAGSHRDPGPYVGLDILEVAANARIWAVKDIAAALQDGLQLILLGDFGAGKSMTMREVFRLVNSAFRQNKSPKFAIHLNLGEHFGQTDPAEALTRHGHRIGFHAPYQLVRAWKSGRAILLLDGFDEMGATNWSGDEAAVKDARRRAVELIRAFNDERHPESGILVAGREHYFDNAEERRQALGYARSASELSLNDFSDKQVRTYLQRKEIPTWLPRRPYLLGYLAARDLLPRGQEQAAPSEGWHRLLDGICEREARVDAGIDGPTVRRFLERLGSYARDTLDGLGPLSFDQMARAFRDVVGRFPEHGDTVLLQRLAGLGVADPVTGSRRFIDAALADSVAAGDPLRFALNPFAVDPALETVGWHKTIAPLGAEVLAYRLEQEEAPVSAQRLAIEKAVARGWNTLAFDLVQALDAAGGTLTESEVFIGEVWVDKLDLGYSGASFAALRLADCVIQTLDVDAPLRARDTPTFLRCTFGHVAGVSSAGDLPDDRFIDCSFESFSEATNTTQAILRMRLPLGVRVALTILKKLYLQPGTGRRDGALRRGLDEQGKARVDAVLGVLQSHNLTAPARIGRQLVWLPIRGERPRALRILSSPMTASDPSFRALESVR